MKAIIVGFGDWNENSIECVELNDFSVESVKENFKKVFGETFENDYGCSFEEAFECKIGSNDYVISIGESVFSEFGFEIFNLDKMIELRNAGKVLKTNYNNSEFEVVDSIEMEELVYEWNETDYSVLVKYEGDIVYYSIVDFIEQE